MSDYQTYQKSCEGLSGSSGCLSGLLSAQAPGQILFSKIAENHQIFKIEYTFGAFYGKPLLIII